MKSTVDSLWQGRLTFRQPARGAGYRFNLDPVLLAGFVEPVHDVLELGTGCGVLGILLLRMGKAQRVTGIELQPGMCAFATENVERNVRGRMQVIEGSLQTVAAGPADTVVFNPPYIPRGMGHPPKDAGSRVARHEDAATLADFVAAAVRLMRDAGGLAAIVPAVRAAELERLCMDHGLRRLRRRQVLARPGDAAHRCLLAARRGDARIDYEPPLVVHVGAGREFTSEVQGWVDGPAE